MHGDRSNQMVTTNKENNSSFKLQKFQLYVVLENKYENDNI